MYHNPGYHVGFDSDDEEDDEYARESRFIKWFAPQERKQKTGRRDLFPRKDFVRYKSALRTYDRLLFPEYTIWENLQWTPERQTYLDQWLADYEELVQELKKQGHYKAILCSCTRSDHLPDRCPRYHSEADKDEAAVAVLEQARAQAAQELAAIEQARKAEAEAAAEKVRQAEAERVKAWNAKQAQINAMTNHLLDAVEAGAKLAKRNKRSRTKKPGPNDPVAWV